jgi:hypothetical protein
MAYVSEETGKNVKKGQIITPFFFFFWNDPEAHRFLLLKLYGVSYVSTFDSSTVPDNSIGDRKGNRRTIGLDNCVTACTTTIQLVTYCRTDGRRSIDEDPTMNNKKKMRRKVREEKKTFLTLVFPVSSVRVHPRAYPSMSLCQMYLKS